MKNFNLLILLLAAAFLSGQELFPYLQAPTPTSIYVNWKTESNPETIVEYGSSPSNLNQSINGSNQILSDVGYNANYFYHTAKIQNLQPNTKYYYRIKTGSLTSDVFSFRTMPLAGQASTEDGHLRFLVLGDNQMRNVPRFDSLVSAARRKIAEKWGYESDPSDNIIMTIMVGDQVDVGTLDHYEHVHFRKNKALSSFLPIQTLVGNHETYGTLGMQAYYDHFVLEEMSYQGISSGTENYYANQVGNVLFIATDTEHPSATQLSWIMQVVNAANNDDTVDWIISLGHRPYQAEQYVGDISTWIRNSVIPVLTTSPKHILHIGAHHHLYHRGQLKDTPTYQIISGGVAWDQYWGMSVEQDFEDVQKTISNWIYQIIDIDVENETFDVENYSIGSVYQWKDNELMDEFHHYKGLPAPEKPEILTEFPAESELPLAIEGSAYQTTTDQNLNTTQFQISKTPEFTIMEKEVYRDFENLYGPVGSQVDSTANLNLGVDITKFTIEENEIPNGNYFIKARYRDENLSWSEWSDTKEFTIINSIVVDTHIETDTIAYAQNSSIQVIFTDAPDHPSAWIGLYKADQTPGSSSPSQLWSYLNGQTSGTMTFNGLPDAGRYYASIFGDGGYTEAAERSYFYVGPFVRLETDKEMYEEGETINITFEEAPHFANDWIGIYKVGHIPGTQTSALWRYVTEENGTFAFDGLTKGYYYAEYYLQDGYNSIGNKVFFQVGEHITQLAINKTVYNLNENIIATWSDGPGIIKDWLGIYHEGDDPNVDELLSYTYFDGLPEGTTIISEPALPTDTGEYFIVMFTNDSYTEVSNRVEFEVVDPTMGNYENENAPAIQVYPNPTKQGEKTFIKSKYPIQQIDVYDLTGNLFYTSKNINNYDFSIINQSLPKGTYILKIHSNKLHSVKIIIK
ncbi:fibronectin type III domain-containing protein [Moheibacter sediminis]|uniref:Por secretion system C-terminal sorting domain-containing protein n=1 Tax=Moheibacter sediminis TaxID=1434700 RepID=A0A1W2C1G0_9FLAO|nr:fibronectin type III domain-containing protein [Moheibacter sediminis]SMC79075.1 Por secretion system C-terminal sorting domain-containing protein [Moheibacter sediminis]